MKLPLNFLSSGGGNGYHNYGELPFDVDDIDTESDDAGVESNEVDFSEYLWMENEEEFDKNEWQRLEEEELMIQCIENMLDDAYDNDDMVDGDGAIIWPSQPDTPDICHGMSALDVPSTNIENSTLNPLAKEFVPSSVAH